MNETRAERSDLNAKDSRPSWTPEAGCPMASMCSGMFERGSSRFFLWLPGVVLILLGVAILIQPQILVWLVAGAAVLLGVAMLLMALVMYRFGAKIRAARG